MLDNLNSKFESSRVQALDVNDDEVEIDLLEIFHALRKKILLVLMVALIGGCIGAACTQFLMTPIYSSTSSMLVLSKETTLTSLADLQLGFFRNYPLLLLYPMYLNFASSNCLPHLPYIVRFIIFNLLLVPSTNPLL